MKFTDGFWLVAEGSRVSYGSTVYSGKTDSDSLKLVVPCRGLRHKGDTLQGPTLTITAKPCSPDIISLEIVHYDGAKRLGPEFELYPDSAGIIPEKSTLITCPEIDAFSSDPALHSPGFATVKSGNLTAKINCNRDQFGIEFVNEKNEHVTSQPNRSIAYALQNAPSNPSTSLHSFGAKPYIISQTSLAVGEKIYGFGERFTPFIKNGQSFDSWNADGGTSSEQAYKCVSFFLSSNGYGVFVDSSDKLSFEVASEKASRVQVSSPGERLKYFLIYGPSPKEILAKYTLLTGRPALPPTVSMGLWLSTSFLTTYDEATVSGILTKIKEHEIPLSVFHFDCLWMEAFHWSDFKFDPKMFPNPQKFIANIKALIPGLRVCLWINPYISQHSDLFEEGVENGYFLKQSKESGGGVWQWDNWQPGMALVDFTNPAASEWFASKLQNLLDLGADYFKTDFGERIPTDDVEWFDKNVSVGKMHNLYSNLYQKVVFDLLEKQHGKGQAVLFARSGTAGGQRFPVHWGGDCESTFVAMAESLRGGLSLTSSGYGFWSHDIGGFEGLPSMAVYMRWVAFGLLSSHSRLHGSSSYRVPWLYEDPLPTEVVKYFSALKCKLMPYLWAQAVQTHVTGVPMMRSMFVEFPHDLSTHTLDLQYMLGDEFLVAPVFSSEEETMYYVPTISGDEYNEFEWTHYLTGKTAKSGAWAKEKHGFLSIPLLVRPGGVIVEGSRTDVVEYDFLENVNVRVYGLGKLNNLKKEVKVHAKDTKEEENAVVLSLEISEAAISITVVKGQLKGEWTATLIGVTSEKVASVDNGRLIETSEDELLEGNFIQVKVAEGVSGAKVVVQIKHGFWDPKLNCTATDTNGADGRGCAVSGGGGGGGLVLHILLCAGRSVCAESPAALRTPALQPALLCFAQHGCVCRLGPTRVQLLAADYKAPPSAIYDKLLSMFLDASNGRSSPSVVNLFEDDVIPSSNPNFWQRNLLPIHLDFSNALITVGNPDLPMSLVSYFKTSDGTFELTSASSPLDLYALLFRMNFVDLDVALKDNPDFRDPVLNYSTRTRNLRPDSFWERVRRLFLLQPDPDLDFPLQNIPRPHWEGLSRYSAINTRRNLGEEYAKTPKILECKELELQFISDVPGLTPLYQQDATLTPQEPTDLQSSPPRFAIEITAHDAFMNYGPWTDRQRITLQSYFSPPSYRTQPKTPPSLPGYPRAPTHLNIIVTFEGANSLKFATREVSKDWIFAVPDGTSRKVVREAGILQFKFPYSAPVVPEPVNTRLRRRHLSTATIASTHTVARDPEDVSRIEIVVPMVVQESGTVLGVKVMVAKATLLSSVHEAPLLVAQRVDVKVESRFPRKWNDERKFDVIVKIMEPTLMPLRDHIDLIIDSFRDFGSGGGVGDVKYFVPMRLGVDIVLEREVEVGVCVNLENVIDAPNDRKENSFMIVKCPKLMARIDMTFLTFDPTSSKVPFSIEIVQPKVSMSFPASHTIGANISEEANQIGDAVSVTLRG
ncbi:hypothetical protein HK096_008008, partial [Nowakowskiella sp. JEL0078]